jgi:hypothetical protein
VYVDDQTNFAVVALLQGFDVKQSVRTANERLTSVYTVTAGFYKRSDNRGPNVLDGVTLIATNRILVKNSTNGA